MIDRLWIREFVERQSCKTTRVHILSVQAVQKRPNRNMVNRFRAKIAGLSIILHPFGIFLRNSILKFFGAYGIFYFRLLCLGVSYCIVWLFQESLQLFWTWRVYWLFPISLHHKLLVSANGSVCHCGDLLTSWVIRVLQLIAKACRQHV